MSLLIICRYLMIIILTCALSFLIYVLLIVTQLDDHSSQTVVTYIRTSLYIVIFLLFTLGTASYQVVRV